MDRPVFAVYGWRDILTDCEFLLDHEIDEAIWGGKKKPYRYRWSDTTRDEVLARLLELNADRAAEEAHASTANCATLTPGDSRPQPQRRTARNRSRPVAEPRGLWDDNPSNGHDLGASTDGQGDGEPDPGAGVDGQGNAGGQED